MYGQTVRYSARLFLLQLNQGWAESNCKLKIFVYLYNTPLNLAEVQQAVTTGIMTTGINESGTVPVKFELSQNYPNPFNPKVILNSAYRNIVM